MTIAISLFTLHLTFTGEKGARVPNKNDLFNSKIRLAGVKNLADLCPGQFRWSLNLDI